MRARLRDERSRVEIGRRHAFHRLQFLLIVGDAVDGEVVAERRPPGFAAEAVGKRGRILELDALVR